MEMCNAVQKVRYLAILASEEGLKNVLAEFPDLHVSNTQLKSRHYDAPSEDRFLIGFLSLMVQ